MTVVQLRTSANAPDIGADLLLDWFEGDKAASTINVEKRFLGTLPVERNARELFCLAAAVYCADKLVARQSTEDFWTRDFEFVFSVEDTAPWLAAKPTLEAMLTFLSGDRVRLTIAQHEEHDDTEEDEAAQLALPVATDAVCLFSGGLDSLTGAVDLLVEGRRLVLVGHHDSAVAENRQELLARHLAIALGEDAFERRPLYLRPASFNPAQARPNPTGEPENTTRTRSFLFVAAAVAVASASGPGVPVVMPENGLIGVNVPLTRSRSGSLSTRTTHPLYVHYFQRALTTLGLHHPIENPFRLQTKGELIEGCFDRDLLQRLAPLSVSCSHPEAARWHKGKQGNCGSCYPCLIRRASMHRMGWDDPADYDVDALSDPRLLRPQWTSGASLRSLVDSLRRPASPTDVLLNGRIPDGEAAAFYELWLRGRDELHTWLDSGAAPALKRRYA